MPQGSDALFDRAIDVGTLHMGWERVRSNRGAAGPDRVTVGRFAEDFHLRLARLHRALASGVYAPGPLRRVDVPKRSGGTRTLAIPTVEDRIAQTAVAFTIGPLLDAEFEDESFGYRPGRSVRMAVDRVSANYRAGYEWVVDGDIERFFDTVPHERLMEQLARVLSAPRLLGLVRSWLVAYGEDGRGLPQGSPISPLLANLYLDEVDERIAVGGVRLVRFGDDFVLMCKREKTAEKALERMAALLGEYGLRLHREKSRVVSFDEGFRFLGHLFVRSVRLRSPEPEVEAPPEQEVEPPPFAADAPVLRRAEPEADVVERVPPPPPLSPRLRLLYVMTPGRALARRDEAFTVTEDGRELLALHHRQLDRIELGPMVDVEPDAMRLAIAEGVPIALVDGWGELDGELTPPLPERAGLHLDQARLVLDASARTALAATLVAGRLHNQRALLYRLARLRAQDEVRDRVREAAQRITRIRKKLRPRLSVPEIMGIEGEAGALYWPALGDCLLHGWRFKRRRRRPPPDPVNLVLSWLSALLYRDTLALIARHGLHPGFGVLHEPADGQPALASDLVEALRAPLVESLTVYLFNNRILQQDDFARNDDGSCRIDAEASRRVLHEWEQLLARSVQLTEGGDEVLWRGVIEEQVLAYRRHAVGTSSFAPYAMGY